MLRWVNSACEGNLVGEYGALKKVETLIADVVSDESKTSHFSLLPCFPHSPRLLFPYPVLVNQRSSLVCASLDLSAG